MLTTEWGKGRPASCRDKGRSGVDEGALCLSSWGGDRLASGNPDHSSCHQDKHKAQYISNRKEGGTSRHRKTLSDILQTEEYRLEQNRKDHVAMYRVRYLEQTDKMSEQVCLR